MEDDFEGICEALRSLQLHEIDTDDVLAVLKPRWSKTPETADRLRGRIENVLDAAKAKRLRSGENPARWRGHLDQLLPRMRKGGRGHHAALPFDRMEGFMKKLREREAVAARALELLILTAARTSEIVDADWKEIDFRNCVWNVPAVRMKAGRAHRVPLTAPALAILLATPAAERKGRIFKRNAEDLPLSNMAMPMLLRRMDIEDTVHGFRSSFRDWAAEETNFPNEVCEMALAHTIPGKAEAAQAALSKSQRNLAQASRIANLGILSASIAHDLNQPLGAILMDAQAALNWLGKPSPDLEANECETVQGDCVLLDVNLPEVDGFACKRRLEEIGSDLPVIFMSGRGDIPMTVRAMKAGARDFLTKPLAYHHLIDALLEAIGSHEEHKGVRATVQHIANLASSLTPREKEVMSLVTRGRMNKQIAYELGIAEITVKLHRGKVMRKMKVRSVAELVKRAELIGLT